VRNDFVGEDLAAYDRIAGPPDPADPEADRTPEGPYGILINSPLLLESLQWQAALAISVGERADSYSHAERELVDLLVGFDWGYFGHFSTHLPTALGVGVPIETIQALREGRESELGEGDRQLVDFIRRVRDRTMTDEVYGAMEARLGQRGAVEYTIWITRLCLMITLMMAFGVASPSLEEVDAMLDDLRGAGHGADAEAYIRGYTDSMSEMSGA
jgi:hypothetical protein